MSENPFVQQVRDHPGDDVPRLIYADYLEESGSAQGSLIRVQVQLTSLAADDPRRRDLERRETQLLDEHSDALLHPIRELGVVGTSARCFHKGLIEHIKIEPQAWAANGEEISRLSPALQKVQFIRAAEQIDALVTCTMPAQIVAVDLSNNRLQADHIALLESASWRSGIGDLDLSFNRLADEGVAALTKQRWHDLHALVLSLNKLGPDAASSLANWQVLGGVRSLSLAINLLGDVGTHRLMRSPYISALEDLDLSSNQVHLEGVKSIVDSKNLASLKRLSLRSNDLTHVENSLLAKADRFAEIDVDLRSNRI